MKGGTMFFKNKKDKRVIVFDLEGPLSPQDHALEIMKLKPGGEKVFSVLSRYDDLLTLEGREAYEPGDTLKLIVPFLLYYGITENDLKNISSKAKLVDGSRELVEIFKKEGWKIYIISTSYQQHTMGIAERLGIPGKNVFCTKLSLNNLRKIFRKSDFSLVERANAFVSNFIFSEDLTSERKDGQIKNYLDLFFWGNPLFEKMFSQIKIMNGAEKVEALKEITKKEKIEIGDIDVVGDSITDYKMLRAVKEKGGLSIAFNANQYALPFAIIGVASTNLIDIKPILERFHMKGLANLRRKILSESSLSEPYYHWIGMKTKEDLKKEGISRIHQEFRQKVRGRETGSLG